MKSAGPTQDSVGHGRFSRRRTLQLLVAAIAGGAAGIASGKSDSSLCSQFVDGLDMNAAGALGREYLERHPLDPRLEEVLVLLRTRANDTAPALGRLREMIRDDYVNGRTVKLSGWFVSQTEACVFARIAMCRLQVGLQPDSGNVGPKPDLQP